MDELFSTANPEVLAPVNGKSLLVGPSQEHSSSILPRILPHIDRLGDRVAVECGDAMLTWAELGQRSEAIANHLSREGVGAGHRVLLSGPRSPDLICCILGILRTGAAYVPVSSETPQARLSHICETLDIDFALIGAPNPELECRKAIFGEQRINEWLLEQDKAFSDDPFLSGDAEAYVIFTSGTTGFPLGIPIQHQQLAASTISRFSEYDANPKRFLLLSDISFDSSVAGLFWTLATGGTLVLPTEPERADIDSILTYFINEKVSHTLCVPVLYGAVLRRAASRGRLNSWIDHVIVAGDHCPGWIIQKHFELVPNSKLSNEFGPTEASVWASVTHYAPELDDQSVGAPIPGVWTAVLDSENQLLDVGNVGELVVGGGNITTGYIGDAEANDERFGELNSEIDLPAGRLHRFVRTGDRAKIEHNKIVLAGRADVQFKSNGRRIDPIEIERRACEASGATNAVVSMVDLRDLTEILASSDAATTARALREANKFDDPEAAMREILSSEAGTHLELILVLESEATIDTSTLNKALSGELPDFMIPKCIASLPKLPLTQNEKVDRSATVASAFDALLAAKTHLEEKRVDEAGGKEVSLDYQKLHDIILSIFRRELKSPDLTGTQSFFDNGGHSLNALNVLLDIEKETGLHLSTTYIFEHPTAVDLARVLVGVGEASTPSFEPSDVEIVPPNELAAQEIVVEGGKSVKAEPLAVAGGFRTLTIPLQSNGSRPPVFAIHNIGEGAKYFTAISRALGPDQPFFCLGKPVEFSMNRRHDEMIDGDVRIEDIARVYADEIERLVPDGPFIIASLCGGVPFGHSTALELASRDRTPALNIMLCDWHAPNLNLAHESLSKQIWKNRWNQIKRERWDLIRTFHKRLPASLELRKQMIRRTAENFMIRYYNWRGLDLTPGLIGRKAMEEALVNLHSFKHHPYSGPSMSIRSTQDPNFWIDEDDEQGWSGVLADWQFNMVEGFGFDILYPPIAPRTAEIFQEKIDRLVAGQHPFREENFARGAEHRGAAMGEQKRFANGGGGFNVALNLDDTDLVPTPKAEQRNWLLNQLVAEMRDEVENLSENAPNMIAGGVMAEMSRRDDTNLDEDQIMEDWQTSLMEVMATSLSEANGDVLEVGFGRGIASDLLQSNNPVSHTIIDCNPHILEKCEQWRSNYADRDIRIVDGLWQNTIEKLGKFDGILFHTYPLSIEELAENLKRYCTFAEEFFPHAAQHLKPNGRFCYFVNERDSLSRRHQRSLLKHFGAFELTQVKDLNIPDTSRDAHWFQDIVCVTAVMKHAT